MSEALQSQESNNLAVSPSVLLQMAVSQDLDIDKLEKLVAMNERFEAREARKAFYAALAKFQSMVPDIPKTTKVEFGSTKYSYAPIGSITKTIAPALLECGLAYRWDFDTTGEIIVGCIVTHINGHSETTTMSAPADDSGKKNAVQSRASTITYLQRYTLIGALGLATAADDNDARQPAGAKVMEDPKAPVVNKAGIEEAMQRLFDNPEGLIEMHFNGASLRDLNNDQLARLQTWVGAYEAYKAEADDCNKADMGWILETYLGFYVIDDPQVSKAPALENLRRSMFARRKITQARVKMGDKIHTAMVAEYLEKTPDVYSLDALDFKQLEALLGLLIKEIKAAKK